MIEVVFVNMKAVSGSWAVSNNIIMQSAVIRRVPKVLVMCFVGVAVVEGAAFHDMYMAGRQGSILCPWSGTCRI